MQDEKLGVDIFALRNGDQAHYALDKIRPALQPGDAYEFDVVVRNKGVGHTFPGGTNDSNEGWLEVSVVDEDGEVLVLSGALQDDGHVDPAAHFYKALMVDKEGRPIHQRNAQDIVTAVYVRTIGPGTSDVAHYSFRLPESYSGQKLTLKAQAAKSSAGAKKMDAAAAYLAAKKAKAGG